jgi:hypothetical protein
MKKSFTLNDFFLLNHIETDKWLDQEISRTTFAVDDLNHETVRCSNQVCGISNVISAPEKRITDNIMNYSRALCVVKTSNLGFFNILLN